MKVTQQTALLIQSAHLFLSAGWNLIGVALISNNQMALGPTASVKTALLLVSLIGLIYLTVKRFPNAYLLISAFILVGALNAILPAFFSDLNLWPSPFWRATGALLNIVGVIGAVLGISISLSTRNAK